MSDKSYRFLIVAGEASGDLHGSGLVHALKILQPNCRFSGLGGKRMRGEGVETFFDIGRMGAVGVVEVLSDLSHYWNVYRVLAGEIRSGKYDAVILIDYPTLNLRLARQCRKHGCRVFFFISPQVWAWRKGRIKDIRRTVDKMFVLFPFEEEMYNKEGVSAEFLGHPFVETVRPTMSREEAIQEFSLDPERKTIGLLPGSRNNEIQFLLDLMIDSAGEIRKEIKDSQFILPVADTLDPEIIRRRLKSNPLDIRVVTGKSYDVMNCCDYLIVASGSATLEAGLMGCPMVIVYRLKWITYWLARLLLNTKVYGLVNIVAGEKVVPELIQNKATAKNVADEALKVLDDPEKHRILRSRLFQVRGSLGEPGVMDRVAGRIFKILQEPPQHEKISV